MPKIIIIVPCYNEAKRLDIDEFLAFLSENPDMDACFVNDGSTDATHDIIENAKSANPAQVKTLHLQHNSGKAESIRQGMLESLLCPDYEWFAYWDADLATPLDEIHRLVKCAHEPLYLLMCSRVKTLGATIDRHVHRHIIGRVMATLISNILHLPVYDTQCGAKLIRRQEIDTLFSEKFLGRWLFDVELIARIQKKYSKDKTNTHVLEVPVRKWQDIAGSKLKFRHVFSTIAELLRIHWKYNIRKK